MTAFLLRTTVLAGAALLPGLLLPSAAVAADVTPEQGQAAEAAFHDWVAGFVGSSFKLPDRPLVLTPAGDHFDAAIAIGSSQPGAKPVTSLLARVRPLDGGKWAVEGMQLQTPIVFTLQMPVPPDDPTDKTTPPQTTPVTYTFDLKGQDGQGTIDPALSGPVTWTNSNGGTTLKVEGGPFPHDTAAGPGNGTTVIQPTGPDTLDMTSKAAIQDYTISAAPDASVPVSVAIKRMSLSMALNGLNRGHARTLTQSVFKVLATLPAPNADATPPGTPPDIAPELAATMIGALQDIASAMTLDEQAEGVAVNAAGVPVTMDKAVLSMNGKSVDGVLQAGMTLSVLGLGIQGALPPDMAALVPTEVTLKPIVTGIGTAEAARLLTAASQKNDPDPADLQAMFSHGGITVGLESMTVALAGATFGGSGSVVFTTPERFTGTAHITATGFDDLMQKVTAIPMFQQQAMPVFALVKGMGKTVGNQLVWDIAYKDGAATVNGMALPGMGGPSAPPPVQPAPRRPAQPQRPQAK